MYQQTYKHLSMAELQAGLAELSASPQDNGTLQMIVCRPNKGERLVMQRAELHLTAGLVGDNWQARGSQTTEDGRAHPEMQIAIMNSRIIHLIAQDQSRWPLAGDQLFIDLDLSDENLPPGQQISIGTAILEVTAIPHNGCAKFAERFGADAARFVNSAEGRQFHQRGINTQIVQHGSICVGDTVSKLSKPLS